MVEMTGNLPVAMSPRDAKILASAPDWLRDFIGTDDREPATFFAGRQAQIGRIEELCARAFANSLQGKKMAGATRVLQGAPGAGKTTILDEMERRWTAGEWTGEGPAPLAVRASYDLLARPDRLILKIARAVNSDIERDRRTTVTESVDMGINISVIKAGGSGSKTVSPTDVTLWELADLLPPDRWPRPVCLMIDEMQEIGPLAKGKAETEATVRLTLHILHLAEKALPIVPVYAGLGNSWRVLKELGLSRSGTKATFGRPFDIGLLSPDEAVSAVETMLEKPPFEVDVARRRKWGERLAKWSDLWPQHLHNAMTALALVAIRDRDYGLAGESLKDRCGKQAMAFRWHSYGQRVDSDALQDTPYLVAKVMADLPKDGLIRPETITVIERHVDDRPGWRLPKKDGNARMDSDDFLNHLVHKGLLQETENRRYVCPIPTLRTFLMLEGDLEPDVPGTRLLTRQEPVPDDRTATASLPDPTDIGDPSPFRDPFGWAREVTPARLVVPSFFRSARRMLRGERRPSGTAHPFQSEERQYMIP